MVVAVQFCSCEPDFLRLLRFNFWGATPTKPELAFTMDLMKLLHTLNLECQVAVKDFCSAIQTLVDDIISFPVLDSLKIIADSVSLSPAILINQSSSDYEIWISAKSSIVLNIRFKGDIKEILFN